MNGPKKQTNRRQQIEAMLESEPDDAFLRYCLAMEMDKAGEQETSFQLFKQLMNDEKPHVPAFFMAAQQRARLGEIDVSKSLLRAGIEEARNQGDQHAAAEMAELLQSL